MVFENIVLTVLAAAGAAFLGWQFSSSSRGPMEIFGLCLAIPSFVLWSLARFELGKSFTVTAQARQLVTRGLYSRIRNPIYVFGSVFMVGYILFIGRPRWLLILVIIIPLQIWRMGKEAKVLDASFGEDYRTYRAKTWF